MPDTTSTDETKTETTEGQEPGEGAAEKVEETASEQVTEETTGEAESKEGEESDDSKLSHEDALKALAKVRREAAQKRTRLAELETKLEGAKTPEEVEAIKQELKGENATENRNLLVENVALRNNLPDELASALKGETREELEAHAKILAKFVPAEPTEDPVVRGGLEPGEGEDAPFDALKIVREMRNRRF